MITETMTVHKALKELKTIDSRISKEISNFTSVFANKHSNKKYKGISINEQCENMKSQYDKINSLISRRNAIKKAVSYSNAITNVKINDIEYSVAEAIEMKNSGIDNKYALLCHIRDQYANAKSEIDMNNGEALDKRADNYVISIYGASDKKNISDEVNEVRNKFVEMQSMELVDPLNVNDIIDKLENEINDFVIEVDSALSVSNALTEIEVSY